MSLEKLFPDNKRHVRGYDFEWTDKHFTPEQLMPLRQQADDLALAVVEKLLAIVSAQTQEKGGANRPDLYTVLKDNYANDSTLRQFWEETHSVPDWVDWEELEKGQSFLFRYLAPNITGIVLQDCLGENATTAGTAETFIRTGGFNVPVLPKRFLETFQWQIQVSQSLKSVQPGGDGHISTIRVRLLHAMVRHRILKITAQNPEYYDFEKYGTPINQLDCMHAICVFCVNTPFVQLPKIGVKPDPQLVKEYLALYRYIAYLLGTPSEYFATVEQAKATMESIMFSEPGPTASSKVLTENFIEMIRDFPGVNISKSLIETGVRQMNNDQMADELGLSNPGYFFQALFRGYCGILVAISQMQHWVPFVDRFMTKTSKSFLVDTVLASPMLKGGSKYEFKHVPSLKKRTTRQYRAVGGAGIFRPVETLSCIAFLIQALLYVVPLYVVGRVLSGTIQTAYTAV
ncbi:hypothetical protein N7492_009851 [Penicillium capsulatum]|uniref:ER-bound oxygenase mpaB/mpaB'/Rubber oxygenase catalytic domain-containing protein n=1 Tax=Penicillium capsulatum TaxID=69766 RepID=A0A9W9HLC0_9EURO|nr:hypothetical protein N7492_009851 [Penicillium capsulatum]KAJ6112362.1 hypothetical protein N7512_007686 [Penicillium capsulatum]